MFFMSDGFSETQRRMILFIVPEKKYTTDRLVSQDKKKGWPAGAKMDHRGKIQPYLP